MVSKAQKNRLVELMAKYILTEDAPIKIRQRAYNAYMRHLVALEKRFPEIDFRSDETQTSLVRVATKLAKAKMFHGPGSTY